MAEGNVEQMPRCNAGWIVVVVLGPGRRYLQKRRSVLECRAQVRWD